MTDRKELKQLITELTQLFTTKEFELVDLKLQNAQWYTMSDTMIGGLIRFTVTAKEHLPSWNTALIYAANELYCRKLPVDQILMGLNPPLYPRVPSNVKWYNTEPHAERAVRIKAWNDYRSCRDCKSWSINMDADEDTTDLVGCCLAPSMAGLAGSLMAPEDYTCTEFSKNDRKDVVDVIRCSRCSRVLKTQIEPHTCPFQVEVHEDNKYLCTCCPECTLNECQDGI